MIYTDKIEEIDGLVDNLMENYLPDRKLLQLEYKRLEEQLEEWNRCV